MNDRLEPQTMRRLAYLVAGVAVVLFAGFLYLHTHTADPDSAASGNLPIRLSNSEFWAMVTDFSEPGGSFHSDNFLSNEIGLQEVIPELRQTVKAGGVYLGVGPEQNFTYISALRPRMAFIVDIRRQNMIEQLLYKAFMELASDRAGFISMLFARPRPPDLGSDATAGALFRAFDKSNPNSVLFEEYLQRALDHLEERGMPLSFGDKASMRKVYRAFFEYGPDLSYAFAGNAQYPGRGMPSYSELMTATDRNGKNWGYLATEDQFETVRQLEQKNLIVPLVGNFAGDKALRTVGNYVRDHKAIVTTFYLSNVEQYLFNQNDDWSRFYSSAATLPVDASSTFIRSTTDRRGNFTGRGRPRSPLRMLTSSIEGQIQEFNAGWIHSYYDVIAGPNTIN